jgi:peptide-methionine (S)-S-oxide reductase
MVQHYQPHSNSAHSLYVSAARFHWNDATNRGYIVRMDNIQTAVFGMGCFWGAERLFWSLDGVSETAVGYAGGATTHPSYKEVCSGTTHHAEVVLVKYDPSVISYSDLLHVFWENHDPTQGMRQGNDFGTQYRSTIYTTNDEQAADAKSSCNSFQSGLTAAGYGTITTEIAPLDMFYIAEEYHQKYLAKNPDGYCGIRGTGVTCASGV